MSALWDMVSSYDDLEPQQLALALQAQCRLGLSDPRTRQLAYECWLALKSWNVEVPELPPALEPVGKFTGLQGRIGLVTTAESILGFLREISLRLPIETRIVIGGSSSLILDHLIQRATQDIDLVDEIPEALRQLRAEMERAESVYQLHLAHFQSHYLPQGWENRLLSLPPMRKLQAFRVSSLDVYAGKLFSRREKDGRDLVALRSAFPQPRVQEHVFAYCSQLLGDLTLRAQIEDNWYVLYGEDLPELL